MTSENRKAYHREYMRKYNRERYANDPEYKARKRKASKKWKQKQTPTSMASLQRKALLKHRYGMAPEEFDSLLVQQNGECAVCRSPDPGASWHIDHCHETEVVRGILCQRCNMALGLFADDPIILEQAIKYLTRGGNSG